MFTKTTIVLLGLFAICEVCTLIVFCYQRTVRKLALRLGLAQSALNVCYPPWMLAMYWATFSKYIIVVALLIIDWRCALVAVGIFALFFIISACISVPDGANLIRIYKEIKRRGSRTLGAGAYQMLIAEIEKGIEATGGDLAKLNEERHENLEWDTRVHLKRGSSQIVNTGNKNHKNEVASFSEEDSDLVMDDTRKRRNEILESKDIKVYIKLFQMAPASVKLSVAIWSICVVVGFVIGMMRDENIQSIAGTAFVNVLFIGAILRGSRNMRNFYTVGVVLLVLFAIINIIVSDPLVDSSISYTIFVNGLIAFTYICPLFSDSASRWLDKSRQIGNVTKGKPNDKETSSTYADKERMQNSMLGVGVLVGIIILLGLMLFLINESSVPTDTNIDEGEISDSEIQSKESTRRTLDKNMHIGKKIQSRKIDAQEEDLSKLSDEELDARIARLEMKRLSAETVEPTALDYDKLSNDELQKIIDSGGEYDPFATHRFLAAFKGKRYNDAAKLIESIDCDNANVQYALGMMYGDGVGVARDELKAVKWMRKAAEQNLSKAQCVLGCLYMVGKGVARNNVEAVKWIRKAAEQGNVEAQSILGECYFLGNGVTKDVTMAIKWFRKAAEQGLADTQWLLGNIYESGNGVVMNEREAVKWYRKAAKQGNKEAQEALRKKGLKW